MIDITDEELAKTFPEFKPVLRSIVDIINEYVDGDLEKLKLATLWLTIFVNDLLLETGQHPSPSVSWDAPPVAN